MEFKRREGALYPQTYSSFQVKVKDSDEFEEFFIQDLTENYFDVAVDFIVENHARGAVFHRAANTLGDENGVQRVSKMYRNVFKEKISLICIKMGTNEVVGVNALTIKSKGELIKPDTSGDTNFKLLTDATNFIHSAFDIMEYYDVDRIMYAAGLSVDKKFRGRGIATEILKARAPLMREIGLEVTSAIFSTVGGQLAASKAGYEENFAISYKLFEEKFPEMNFSHVFNTSCKVLSLKI